jgi:hypothetical protein
MNPNIAHTYVRKKDITAKDFLVVKGGANQNRTAHKNLYNIRDDVYVSHDYPSLGHAGKRRCQITLLRALTDSGGRMLKQVEGDDDLFYEVPERKAWEIMAQKLRQPRPEAKAALEERRLQLKNEQGRDVHVAAEVEVTVVVDVNQNADITHDKGSVTIENEIDLNLRIETVEDNHADVDIAAVTFEEETHVNHLGDFDFLEYPLYMNDMLDSFN